jgi:hypothetical protein
MAHLLLAALLLLPAGGTAKPVEPGSTLALQDPRFEIHSALWVNLHHVLHAAGSPEPPRHAAVLQPPDMTPAEAAAWARAVETYRGGWSRRDLLFDDAMIGLKAVLSRAGNHDLLPTEGVPPDLHAALSGAAPVYRTRLWPAHDAANRAWASAVRPLLEEHGEPLAREVGRALDATWAGPVRVDLAVVANWAGAYTSIRPTHVTVGSTDPRHQGPGALETLFHEAAHGLVDPVRRLIAEEEAALSRPAPRQLWHAVLFWSVGEVVRRRLPGYTPYADAYGLWERGSSAGVRGLLAQHWGAWLDGRLGAREAIRAVLAGAGRQD